MATQVHFVRHGQTDWNVQHILQGAVQHVELNEQGHRDAARAASGVRELIESGEEQTVLYSSDLRRAVQTAERIASETGLEIIFDKRLRERDFGDFEGRPHAELRAFEPPDGIHLHDVRHGAGESVGDTYRRIAGFLDDVLPGHAGKVVLVTHGVTIRTALAYLDGVNHHDMEWVITANGAIVTRDVRLES